MLGLRARLRGGNEDGAVAVEAALILPILVLLVFGIIEFSMLMRDHVALTSAVRNGARIASAEPRIPSTDTPYGVLGGASSRVPALAQDAADAIARSGTALPKNSIDELWVYQANNEGYPVGTGNFEAGCATNCLRYQWVADAEKFRFVGGSWNPDAINACPGDPNAMSVGVYMRAEHEFVTGLFGTTATVSDHAVMKFEPIPVSQGCK